MRLSDEAFEAVVEDALASIPDGFHRYLQEIVVDVEDMPDDEICEELGVDPRGLLGLYQGVPLTERSVSAPYQFPERITLYRRNIERMCRTRRQMVEQIRKTVLHEIGHHFGLSEQHLRDLGFE
ncbi:MAG TPA: metallopeptidase family protein [Phycisphaerae bacterium]|nr:metallopeptidase family protein [Phycisphaerae bacterium]HOJ74206.1 metallopeptidase family protein [Phycisphaerae bacterium]HOM51284.1 metallopeptidase family protein [Phycisphaerae bacterium]HON65843.1 metallopeptidase family protein [Phycisphaerae bacterium]HOQ84896.1 metallopeptidase family protein [Phycisphaerae bacterium]